MGQLSEARATLRRGASIKGAPSDAEEDRVAKLVQSIWENSHLELGFFKLQAMLHWHSAP